MKRDLDLYRAILLKLEARPRRIEWEHFSVDGYDHVIVAEHLHLLFEAGYIDGGYHRDEFAMQPDGVPAGNLWLRNDGHDFLDSIRDERVWLKTKKRVLEVTGSASLEVVKHVAEQIARQLFA